MISKPQSKPKKSPEKLCYEARLGSSESVPKHDKNVLKRAKNVLILCFSLLSQDNFETVFANSKRNDAFLICDFDIFRLRPQ